MFDQLFTSGFLSELWRTASQRWPQLGRSTWEKRGHLELSDPAWALVSAQLGPSDSQAAPVTHWPISIWASLDKIPWSWSLGRLGDSQECEVKKFIPHKSFLETIFFLPRETHYHLTHTNLTRNYKSAFLLWRMGQGEGKGGKE